MIEVYKFNALDVCDMEMRPEDWDRNIYQNINEFLDTTRKGDTFTIFCDGEVMAICGVVIYREGFGEAWVVFSKKVREHMLIVLRTIKNLVEGGIAEHKLYRLQAVVKADWLRAQKFLDFLDFSWEGILRKYGPDQSNYYMYSRIT